MGFLATGKSFDKLTYIRPNLSVLTSVLQAELAPAKIEYSGGFFFFFFIISVRADVT